MNRSTLMNFFVSDAEDRLSFLLSRQIIDEKSPFCGAVPEPGRLCPPFPRNLSVRMLEMTALWLCPQSSYFADPEIPQRMKKGLAYLKREQRPSGNIDLWDCNFDSAPDSGFFLWDLIPLYRFLDDPKSFLPQGTGLPGLISREAPLLRDEVKALILTVLEGLRTGGFHTANHRWVMASALTAGFNLTGNKAYMERAKQYLAEGIDCNEDGEYSERSTIYNAVNNQAMIMLYEETGGGEYLAHVRRNLGMLVYYFEADGSLFTGNSTRQDRGQKMYAAKYLFQYLYIAHHFKDEQAARIAEYIAGDLVKNGRSSSPDCLPFLMQRPELDFGRNPKPDSMRQEGNAELPDYNRYFKSSGIVRYKKGVFSYSLIHDNPAFLCFNCGTLGGYLKISMGYFSWGHIKIRELETLQDGYRFVYHTDGYYFEPLENPSGDLLNFRQEDHSIRKIQHPNSCDLTVTVRNRDRGIGLIFSAAGIDGVHYGLDFMIPAGLPVSGDHFVLLPKPGDYVLLKDGGVTVLDGVNGLSIKGGFADTDLFISSRQAEPRSAEGFTVYMNGTSPFTREVLIESC